MIQAKLVSDSLRVKPFLSKGYSKGAYDEVVGEYQHIRLSEGCPNFCEFCAESFENGSKPVYYDIPEIRSNKVRILDMNLVYKPKAIGIINELGSKKYQGKVVYYELWCGIDYRFITPEIAAALKKNRFVNPRLAWDHGRDQQVKIQKAINILVSAGYKRHDILVFMIGNWKISPDDYFWKMYQCAVMGVQVDPCWFDNQVGRNVKPMHWLSKDIVKISRIARKHNQLIRHKGVDPELKGGPNWRPSLFDAYVDVPKGDYRGGDR